MPDLATLLDEEQKRTSYRALEAKTGVSRGALEHIIQRRNSKLPELETLQRIAAAFGKPLWEVIEMTGIDLQLPQHTEDRIARLLARVDQAPLVQQHVERLLDLSATDPAFVQGMVLAIEALLRQRTPYRS